MSGYLLDTNVISELSRPVVNPTVEAWVAAQEFGTLRISVVTVGEFEKSFTMMKDLAKRTRLESWLEFRLIDLFHGQTLSITQEIAKRWGRLQGERQMAGRPLGVADGMIAATALEHQLVLVTRNTKDFEGLGASLLNPWADGPNDT